MIVRIAGFLVGSAALVTSALAAAPDQSVDGVWRNVNVSSIATRGTVYTRPVAFRTLALDDSRLAPLLAGAPPENSGPGVIVHLPLPDGGFAAFEVARSPIMAPELAERYPRIQTYAGQGVDDPSAWVRLDRTPQGFHAMFRNANGTVYIDPYQISNGAVVSNNYQSYYSHHRGGANDQAFSCGVHEARGDKPQMAAPLPGANRTPTGAQLRTYRLAVAATGEYTAFHGGTVNAGMAAIVTAINRVTGIYQSELSVRLELIANNDSLVFTNAASDGYTNSNGFTMLSQNQAKLDSVIGAGNYDIGHVFSTGGGGVAGLGVVCRNGNKGRGVTGLGSPIGDVFYVDFVSHEMGHQFGANHSFNGTAGSCASPNRNGSTAYEPGSGSTIMGYAGICGSHNIANFSDDYFHTVSFDEMVNYTNFSSGSACDALTNTGNLAPVVDAGPSYTVPVDTPLKLIGSATDGNGDSLLYRWEQFDLGPGGSPNTPTGNAPLFRSFPAVATPERYLPRLNDILNNTLSSGERLPTYARNMRFRLTALDGRVTGGGVDYDSVTHSVTATAGPFDVTSQNSNTVWTPGEQETITWDVANTDLSPVSCASVDILFSADLGLNFSTTLAAATANDGSHAILVPDIQTNIGRVMVACSDNIFLDINNRNITVVEASDPDFNVIAELETLEVCTPNSADVEITVLTVGGFTDAVTLATSGAPAGVSTSFSPNQVTPGNTSQLTIDTAGATLGSVFALGVAGTSTTGTRSDTLDVTVTAAVANAPSLTLPVDLAIDVSRTPTLVWEPVANAQSYLVEIATDDTFSNIVYSASEATTSHVVGSALNNATLLYWRVSAQNFCGAVASGAFSFTTLPPPLFACGTPFASIPDNGSIVDTFNIAIEGTVNDINVDIAATHGNVSQLAFELTNEATGTTVVLIDRPGIPLFPTGCPLPDVSATLDDEASASAEEACANPSPALGGDLLPNEPLSAFDGESIAGDWTLVSRDLESGTTGSIGFWCVEITVGPEAAIDTDGDTVADDLDNCTLLPNPDQRDTNGDGFGNLCDADLNDDLIINPVDLGLFRVRFFSTDPDADFNGDGIVNTGDLGILRTQFFSAPGPSGIAP